MKYSEDKLFSKNYKAEYKEGIERLIANREKSAAIIRENNCKNIFQNQEYHRKCFKDMLGWPLNDESFDYDVTASQEKLSDEGEYSLFRISFKIMDEITMTGLLLKYNDDEKRPFVISQHGGLGTPELTSGVYEDTCNYNDMTQRILLLGANVFAPQLLLWKQEDYEVDYDRKEIDGRLKRVGSSITAIEIFGITKIIDYFEKQDYVTNIGMVGLSYGGFYTLFTTAIDTRIKSAISCSFFNTREKYAWTDWTWDHSAEKFEDAEIACLVYPRNLCIEIGKQDELFDYQYGAEEFERLQSLCEGADDNWLSFIGFDGKHEFCKSDEPIKTY
ncbi:MAG: hypothetical protein SPH44_04215 [Eubacteriales bacterium]|nr:hypothetical protein [Eubacteriales bacterium]